MAERELFKGQFWGVTRPSKLAIKVYNPFPFDRDMEKMKANCRLLLVDTVQSLEETSMEILLYGNFD